MKMIDSFNDHTLIHRCPLLIIHIPDRQKPLLRSISDQLALHQGSFVHLWGPRVRNDENLGVRVSLLNLLVDQERIVGFVNLCNEHQIRRPTALETHHMGIREIPFVALIIHLRIPTLVRHPRTPEAHLIQDVLLGFILCDIVYLNTTEIGSRKTSGFHASLY
jgi:hypothetical protein